MSNNIVWHNGRFWPDPAPVKPSCAVPNCQLPDCRLAHLCDCDSPSCSLDHDTAGLCVSCGAADATTRENNEDGESEPLCRECWREYDLRADERYCEMQISWATNMRSIFKGESQ